MIFLEPIPEGVYRVNLLLGHPVEFDGNPYF